MVTRRGKSPNENFFNYENDQRHYQAAFAELGNRTLLPSHDVSDAEGDEGGDVEEEGDGASIDDANMATDDGDRAPIDDATDDGDRNPNKRRRSSDDDGNSNKRRRGDGIISESF